MLLAWLVSHQWQAFSRSDQALSDFEIFRAALLAMEKVSAERGPMNAVLGEDVPMPAQRIAALRKAREESDASLRDLDAAIEASHCEECAALYVTATHAITMLAEARKHADDVLLVPRQTRSPELLDNAVNHMANVIPIIAGIADGTIGDIVSGDAAVLDVLQMARLAAALREHAGLLGSRFTGALASDRQLTEQEQQRIFNSEGRVEQLRTLLASHAGHHPTLAPEAVRRVGMVYGEAGLAYVTKVYRRAKRPMGAGITTGDFAAQYVPTMLPIVQLRDEILDHARARLHRNRDVTLTLLLGAFAIAFALLGTMIWLHSLFRRQILKPFFAATRSILAIANGNLSVRVPSPNNYRGEIRALLEAVHTLKRYSLDKQQLEQDRQRLIAQLTTMAETDALTQLLNRRALEARACDLCASPAADKPYVALVMFDIDHFKRINDTYGHIAGDRALEIVGAVCRDVLGTGDLAARFGGEEFAVVSLVSTPGEALRLAEQLKEKLREIRVTLESARPFGMTVSLGVAIGRREDVGQDLSALIRQADLMLYRAKRGGRNRIEGDWELMVG
ncbi:sensor domain-containing diguanylate cyclase [Cupriavidus metallidurans]|uniref:GGDEF domain-containing protein n=1 Tax=Cupriavidus metallidurans TaxID=119219 RepID=UPI001CCA77BF|nr:GGDEF domain-containing protein [Cupriavidus metallidurans]UBM10662.1 GGDEF domain-containing protein [Cupriavidus metallidurans]